MSRKKGIDPYEFIQGDVASLDLAYSLIASINEDYDDGRTREEIFDQFFSHDLDPLLVDEVMMLRDALEGGWN